jgi:gas vesicle protein
MLVGSAIGAAVALLYAPQPGDMTRDMIKQRAGEAKDRAGELATTARDKASTVAGTISSTVTEKTSAARESASHMVDQVKTTAHDLVDRGRSLVETKKDQVTAAVEAGKQAYQEKRTELEADVQEDLDSSPATSGSTGSTPSI